MNNFCDCAETKHMTDDGDIAEIVRIKPLDGINLTTGEKIEARAKPYIAIEICCEELEEIYLPIKFCPWCGKKLEAGNERC